ncbi:MAG TPA: glycosyltransferase family 2 protein [Gallionellaceae bacterium]|nr:glycosyltransferase family 2 protein [Gallionellaceae bacterium]
MTALQFEQAILSVVIVNYRTPNLVTECLASLLPEINQIDARVVVVDNRSDDNSFEVIRAWLDANDVGAKATIIQSNRNAGFAAGNNIGIKACSARNYLLLNSDTLVRSGAIRNILDTAIRFPNAGMVSPRLEWPDDTGQVSCFRFPSPFSELCDASDTGMIDRFFGKYIVAMPVQTQIARPEWTSFACVLIKDDVFRQVGLLDEGYFMYFEDIEFCYRAVQAGWTIAHNPEAHVVHLRGGSSSVKEQTRKKRRVPKYFYESRTRFFYQTYGWLGLTAANLLWWLGRIVSGTRQLLGRPDKTVVERQWLDIWTNWLNPLKPYTQAKS